MTARGVDFPDKISVRSGLRHVERFRGTCVGHAVFQENLRLVDILSVRSTPPADM